ncbi:hypothetical protein EV589_2482 [Mycobacterium sp. BK558]|uniref:SCP domain-containing protein n=1 Tax=Mycolicibacterium chlorophenolicum TaxID=37916 RepID=A0A0J6YWU6_9MYCO|nr:hypothetical protein [Mycolicibacterium chlorophenolicum]KMO76931.1 hypothetical protein MCHLDSM_03080 [Mycolicibacterium chlorophenolicum]MBI5339900.1 hypothetical protein [Mycolicibacterium rufum]RZT18229.1 hypothetical protein EV589_2482 [Mycobacterium sp. BK558]
MTTRTAVSLALATAFAGSLAAMPVAHADPLDAIINTVNKDRPARCPALKYDRGVLEGAAQTYARSENPVDGQPAGYNGRTLAFLGSGDPQAAATTSAYSRGAGGVITNCDFTEFGVGFIRHEDREVDVVTIVLGAPNKPADPPPVAKGPDPAPVVVPEPPKPDPVAPTDAIRLAFDRGLTSWTVNITNSSALAGTCTYVATNPVLPGVNKTFSIGPNGSTSFPVLPPPPLSTYHVTVSCKGDFNGKNVEFGHVEQDV